MKTYYVCREGRGSDSNSGDKDQPLATFDHALSIARPGDRVVFSADGGETLEEYILLTQREHRRLYGPLSWFRRIALYLKGMLYR